MLQHVWLLLTCRHDGTGLHTRSVATLAAVFALSVAMAWLRWDAQVAIVHGFVLTLMAGWSFIPFAVGCALISAAIDAAGLVLPPAADDPLWAAELCCQVALAFRMARRRLRKT